MKFIIVAFLLLFSCGCADKGAVGVPQVDEDDFEAEFAVKEEFDPFRGYNRAMTAFNDAAFRYVLIPAADGYRKVVPKGARMSIGHFFDNLFFPLRFANNLLQGKVVNALGETGRFIINTTVGFLGFADVADEIYGIKQHDEDFGQTLAVWGIPAGYHIVLPILGPSNMRDLAGAVVDYTVNPVDWKDWGVVDDYWQSTGINAFRTLNGMAEFAPMYEAMTKDAIDLYPFMKNMYEQRREKLIKE
ncbi:MAG: VacJ family lipoprotein [Campylobacteraceae bacterium]|jgi:phospholipid-binding lipoprotein MlaA|nr:VacJ family lipoprotein [Campylobacteraceae bacterium]